MLVGVGSGGGWKAPYEDRAAVRSTQRVGTVVVLPVGVQAAIRGASAIESVVGNGDGNSGTVHPASVSVENTCPA